MSATAQVPTAPPLACLPMPTGLDALEQERESTFRDWCAESVPRELARLNSTPKADKDWLADRGIRDGEYLFATKAQLERQQYQGSLTDRIWACGILATIGYRGELAVKLVNNKHVPFTSNDIRKELNRCAEEFAACGGFRELTTEQKAALHVEKQDLRRALAKLESDGRALRTLRDGTPLRDIPLEKRRGLQEGEILLFFFFRPLPPEPRAVGIKCLPIFASSSPSRKASRALRLLKLEHLDPEAVATDAYLRQELAAAVKDYRKAQAVALRSAQNRVAVVTGERHIRKIVLKDSSERNKGNRPSSSSSVSAVREAMSAYATADDDATNQLIKACKAEAPECTEEQIVAAIHQKAERLRTGNVLNPIGFFLTAVPKIITQVAHPASHRETVPDHLLPTAVKRQRATVADAEAYARRKPGDEGALRELNDALRRLSELEEEYGL